MKRWTDDEIASGLRDSFRRHERDVDPQAARRIALAAAPGRAPRRRVAVVLAAVAAVTVIAGLGVVAVHASQSTHPDPTAHVTDPAPTGLSSGPGTDHLSNRAAAVRAARQALATVPVPPGSTRAPTEPAAGPHHLGCYCGVLDESLTQTGWWTVPLSYRDLLVWYAAHTPANEGSAYYDEARTRAASRGEMDWSNGQSSPAYSTPEIVIGYHRLTADTTAIRVDITLAARFERTPDTVAPDSVTSVDVHRSVLGAGRNSSDINATVVDPSTVTRIVRAFDDLKTSFHHTQSGGCASPAGTTYQYALTLRWPGHTLVNDVGAPLCGQGRGLTLDGVHLTPSLDDSEAFDRILRDVLAGPVPR